MPQFKLSKKSSEKSAQAETKRTNVRRTNVKFNIEFPKFTTLHKPLTVVKSSDETVNDLGSVLLNYFNFDNQTTVKLDDFIFWSERDNAYKILVRNMVSYKIKPGVSFAELSSKNNNPNISITFERSGKDWEGTMTERRYYGYPNDVSTYLFPRV